MIFDTAQGAAFIDDAPDLTIPLLFRRRVEQTPDLTAYSEFDRSDGAWRDISWRDMTGRVAAFQAAFRRTGLVAGDRVGVLLPNGTDWVAFDIAAMARGLILVLLYLRGSTNSIAYVIADSGARLCLLDTVDRWRELEPLVGECPELAWIWIREGGGTIESIGPRISFVDECVRPSKDNNEAHAVAVKRDDVATLVYTSGTTGNPKGVMLSHRSILWNACAVASFNRPTENDVFLSILPLAHAFERTLGYYLPMMAGSRVAYARSIKTLHDDLKTIRPTILLAVPRLFERVYETLHSADDTSNFQRLILDRSADIGLKIHQAHYKNANPQGLVDKLYWALFGKRVRSRVRAEFGGRIRNAVSAGAPLSESVKRFMIGLGVPVVEGYGLTEAAPAVTGMALEDSLSGSVGRPLPGLDVKFGVHNEILVKSPGVMRGYWGNPEATEKVIDKDGWLHTGDIGELRNGYLFITARLKDIIVLSTGENVNPTPVEQALTSDPLVAQACVLGDQHPWLVAVIVLDTGAWNDLAKEMALDPADPNKPSSRELILERLRPLIHDLPPFSRVRDIHLEREPWTLENGILTPTLKVKRAVVADRYKDVISSLYA